MELILILDGERLAVKQHGWYVLVIHMNPQWGVSIARQELPVCTARVQCTQSAQHRMEALWT